MLSDISLVLLESIELGNILSELIVKLREDLSLDSVDLYVKYGISTLEFLRMIILRELNLNGEFLTGIVTDDLILKTGDEGLGADLK